MAAARACRHAAPVAGSRGEPSLLLKVGGMDERYVPRDSEPLTEQTACRASTACLDGQRFVYSLRTDGNFSEGAGEREPRRFLQQWPYFPKVLLREGAMPIEIIYTKSGAARADGRQPVTLVRRRRGCERAPVASSVLTPLRRRLHSQLFVASDSALLRSLDMRGESGLYPLYPLPTEFVVGVLRGARRDGTVEPRPAAVRRCRLLLAATERTVRWHSGSSRWPPAGAAWLSSVCRRLTGPILPRFDATGALLGLDTSRRALDRKAASLPAETLTHANIVSTARSGVFALIDGRASRGVC